MRLAPSYGEARLGLGEAYAKSGQYEKSLPFLREVARLMPDRVEPHYWLGKTLMKLGKTEEGKKELARVQAIHSRQHKKVDGLMRQAPVPDDFNPSAGPIPP